MVRAAAGVLLGAMLWGAALGCSSARIAIPPSPSPARAVATAEPATVPPIPTATASPLPTATPSPTSSLTPTPAGRLPSVAAQVSFSLPGGDAYQPQALTFDEAGKMVVLCYSDEETQAQSAFTVVDPAQGTRGPVRPLPGRSLGPLAAARGRVYLGYEDAQYRSHLAVLAQDSGRVLLDVPSEFLYYGDPLLADPAGRLYIPLRDRLEVRDGITLRVLRTLPYAPTSGGRGLALDTKRGHLYLASGDQVQAYRTADFRLLWQAAGPGGTAQRLVLDRSSRYLYCYSDSWRGGAVETRLVALDASNGQALRTPTEPAGTNGQLVAADSEAGWLLFLESQAGRTHLWQTNLDGQPAGASLTLNGHAQVYVGMNGLLTALFPDSHLLRTFNLADLRPLSQIPLGIEIRDLVTDPGRERVYVDDSAGRLHVLDARTWHVQESLQAGSGPLALDAANGLLFVSHEPGGREVTVIDTASLTVTAVITGGYRVAVDSAGHRAFIGWTEASESAPPGEVQVWDTRTFQRLGTIHHRGEPTYNPLRDEVYLRDYSAYIVDGKTLAVIGELTPDIGQETLRWCNGCPMVAGITVDPDQDVIAVSLTQLSAGKGPGTLPQPRLFSAHTCRPITHTVTILNPSGSSGGDPPFIIPSEDGRVYAGQQYARYVSFAGAVAYRTGSAEPLDYRDGLSLDLYLPGNRVALSLQRPWALAFDPRTWEPLGWIPYQPIRRMDLSNRRLYAWARGLLTILSFDGGQPLAPQPAEPLPVGKLPAAIQQIRLSPDFPRDRTVFVVAGSEILRSTDGGARWARLRGGLPPASQWGGPLYQLAISPAYSQDRTLFACGRIGDPFGLGVWRSTDGGESWTPLWRGLQHLKVNRLVLSPRYAEDHILLAYCNYDLFWRGDSGVSLFLSDDSGSSWHRVAIRSHANGGALPSPTDLLPYPRETVQFRIAETGDGVERSTDGGRTWQTVLRRQEPSKPPLAVERSPRFESDQQVFALFPDRLYRSVDSGTTWAAASDRHLVRTRYEEQFTALAVGLLDSERPVLFVGDSQGLVLPLNPGQLQWGPVPTPTPAAQPMAGASPTPCGPVRPPLEAAYGRWAARLGCPDGPGGKPWMAIQRMEHGWLLWRSDNRQIYVLVEDASGRHWSAFPDTWQEGQPDYDPALHPPTGREQPVRGFGKVWREQLGGPQASVGWALEGEQGFDGSWQTFAQGLLLTAPDGRVYALFADGSWEA